VGTCLGV